MPKTKFQNIVFTLMMSFLMVYAMICYNIALNIHGMANHVFIDAFHELTIMWPVAFLLEFFLVDKMAHHLAFKVVKQAIVHSLLPLRFPFISSASCVPS